MTAVHPVLRSVLRSLPTIAVLAALAWLLWPTSLGGWANFTIVQGTSMEPTYQHGDMLYARSVDDVLIDDVDVGDVVVYQIADDQPGGGNHVVHRIHDVVVDGDTRAFLTLGDNRTDIDQFRPTRDDLVSTPVANLGPWPTRLYLAIPLLLAAVIGLSLMWFLWPASLVDEVVDETVDEAVDEPTNEPVAARPTPPARPSQPLPVPANLRTKKEPADLLV